MKVELFSVGKYNLLNNVLSNEEIIVVHTTNNIPLRRLKAKAIKKYCINNNIELDTSIKEMENVNYNPKMNGFNVELLNSNVLCGY